jgi:hypothetical protein
MAATNTSSGSQSPRGFGLRRRAAALRSGVREAASGSEMLRHPHDVAWMRLILIAIFLGLFCLILNGLGSLSSFTVGLLLAAASLAVGGLAGFLFGVPRSLQTPVLPPVGDDGQSRKQADEIAVRYATNTNLEQISDWLTKILVGVGLTQIGTIVEHVKSASAYFGPALGLHGDALATCVMIYFTISGFFYTYLWTRLVLVGVMSRADQDASEKLRRIEEQDAVDLRALTIVERFISGRVAAADVAELGDAIGAASARAKKLVFYEAEEARTRSWRNNKIVVERTIPVFRALVQTDRDGVFYKTKAKLAYALKDQREPAPGDLEEAVSLLGESIEKRDMRCDTAPLYEFNRAFCRILLDQDFKQGRPASAENRRLIGADLEIARPTLGQKFSEYPIAQWLSLNGVGGGAEVKPIREQAV